MKVVQNVEKEIRLSVNDDFNINDVSVCYFNIFMEEKLDEMRADLQGIDDIRAIQSFLEEQKVIVLSFSISELSIDDDVREKFENLKNQYLTLLDLYLS